MSNWHYYTANREKIGPVTSKELKQLVLQGTVTPETFIEDPTGRTGLAKDVKGLKFPEAEITTSEPFIATPSPFVPTTQAVPMPPVTPQPEPKQVFWLGQTFALHCFLTKYRSCCLKYKVLQSLSL